MKAYIEPTIKIYEFDCDIKAVVLLLLHLLKKIAFTTNQKNASKCVQTIMHKNIQQKRNIN